MSRTACVKYCVQQVALRLTVTVQPLLVSCNGRTDNRKLMLACEEDAVRPGYHPWTDKRAELVQCTADCGFSLPKPPVCLGTLERLDLFYPKLSEKYPPVCLPLDINGQRP